MFRRIMSITVSAIIVASALTGCGQDVSSVLDDQYSEFSTAYNEYQNNHEEYSKSVLDTLNTMLDNYVSGLSNPTPSSIVNTPIPTGGAEANDIINNVNNVVNDEKELEQVLYDTIKNIETDVTVEINGEWCTEDLLYDVVYRKIQDTYMIDAFGLDVYSYQITQNKNGNDVYKINFSYLENMSASQIQNMRNEITRKAKDIIIELNLGSKSDYDKIYEINKYLCDSVDYPEAPFVNHDYTPYGALIDGRAVCDGYSRATKILAEMCGLDCYYVLGRCGDSDTYNHSWNLVKIDGDYYQLDVTWNDCSMTDDYFLVTDDFMSLSREWDETAYPQSYSKNYK